MIDVISLAIEALSWIELKRINEPMAFNKTVEQLGIINEKTMRHAYRLIKETIRRRNALDYLINEALDDIKLDTLKLGVRNLLRLYTYELKYGGQGYSKAVDVAESGRKILGKTLIRLWAR